MSTVVADSKYLCCSQLIHRNKLVTRWLQSGSVSAITTSSGIASNSLISVTSSTCQDRTEQNWLFQLSRTQLSPCATQGRWFHRSRNKLRVVIKCLKQLDRVRDYNYRFEMLNCTGRVRHITNRNVLILCWLPGWMFTVHYVVQLVLCNGGAE